MNKANVLLLYGAGLSVLLSCKEVPAPAPILPVPTPEQVKQYQTIQNDLTDDLLENAYVEGSNTRARRFSPCKVSDNKWETYWATEDSATSGTLTFTLNTASNVNRMLIQEYIPLGERVKSFNIEYETQGDWFPVETVDSTTTIGNKRIVSFQTVKAERLRINFTEARGPLCINNVEAFHVE